MHQRRLRSQRFPAPLFGNAVELFEELPGRIDRNAAAPQRDNLTTGLFRNLQGVAVAEFPRYQAAVALFGVLAQFVAQPSFALRERMPVSLAQLLGCGEDIRPDDRRVVVACTSHRLLRVEHLAQGVQHACVQRILLLLLLRQMIPARQQVIVIEFLRRRVGLQYNLFLCHDFIRIAVFRLETRAKTFRQ